MIASPHAARKTLLFICSVPPSDDGFGMTMRVAFQVRSLARIFDVTLLVLSADHAEPELERLIGADIKVAVAGLLVVGGHPLYDRLRRRLAKHPPLRLVFDSLWPQPQAFARGAPLLRQGLARLGGRSFDALHCVGMQNAVAPKLMRAAGISAGFRVLDINDYESRTMLGAAASLKGSHGALFALAKKLDGLKWYAREWLDIRRFDVSLLCSSLDAGLLARRFAHAQFDVAPNVVRSPDRTMPRESAIFTFLFVGNLGYEPNRDGIRNFFCRSILPRMRRLARRPFRVLIVGRHPDAKVLALSREADIEVVDSPPSVAPFYAAADVAIVPLRAGGGTRIKILEALSHGVPVVSTSLGMEGLEAEPGKHLLVGDDAESFAGCCLTLMEDAGERRRLAGAGRTLFEEKYSADALESVFARVYAKLIS